MSEIEGVEQVYKNVWIQLGEVVYRKGKIYYWANCIFPGGEVISTHYPSKSITSTITRAKLIIDRHA